MHAEVRGDLSRAKDLVETSNKPSVEYGQLGCERRSSLECRLAGEEGRHIII